MTGPRPNWTRLGAVVIALLLLAVLWTGPVDAYFALVGDAAAEIDQRAAVLQRYRALAAEGDSARNSASPGATMTEAPEAQAIARLQDAIKLTAGESRVAIRTVQVLRNSSASGPRRVSVRIAASAGIAELGRLLFAIENARPVLYCDNLHVQARPGSNGGDNLDFQLDVATLTPDVAP